MVKRPLINTEDSLRFRLECEKESHESAENELRELRGRFNLIEQRNLELEASLRILSKSCDTGERNGEGKQIGVKTPEKAAVQQAHDVLSKQINNKSCTSKSSEDKRLKLDRLLSFVTDFVAEEKINLRN